MRRWTSILAALALLVSTSVPAGFVNIGGGRYVATAAPEGTLTASLTASRTSGPAPLPVLFSAKGTTSSAGVDTFRQVGYSFNFGDPGSGTYATTGDSKNVYRGARQIAHVFETPGTYTVKVRALDDSGGASDGDNDQTSVTITVTNPDAVYSGTNTICLSRNTDHTGCPAGATQTSNVTSWPTWASNRRYLLHRGQDFSSVGNVNLGHIQDTQLGAYGSGAKPITADITANMGNPVAGGWIGNWANRISLIDLQAANVATETASQNLLLLRVTIIGGMVELSGAWDCYASASGDCGGAAVASDLWEVPRYHFIVDSFINKNATTDPGVNPMCISAYGKGVVIMGTETTLPWEHDVRLWWAYDSVIVSNKFSGIAGKDSGRHPLKIMSGGTDDVDADGIISSSSYPHMASEDITVGFNIIGNEAATSEWLMGIGPQGRPFIEGLRRIVIEENRFIRGPNVLEDGVLFGADLVDRHNTMFDDGSDTSIRRLDGTIALEGTEWDGPLYLDQPSIATLDPT